MCIRDSNGGDIAFRLQWQDASADTGAEGQDDTGFPDAAAILFPVRPKAPLMSMGAPGLPVNAWYWRADEPARGRHVSAEGLGTSDTVDRDLVKVQGVHRNGEWHVVIARALRATVPLPVAQLEAGGRIGVSVAIWEGSHGERAGIKAFALGEHDGARAAVALRATLLRANATKILAQVHEHRLGRRHAPPLDHVAAEQEADHAGLRRGLHDDPS